MQICKLCDDINANDICPSMLIGKCLLIMRAEASYPDADPTAQGILFDTA